MYRRSSMLLKCTVIVGITLCTVTLMSLGSSVRTQQQKAEQLRQEAILLEQENAAVRADISQLGSVNSVRKIAARELGLADPNTTFFCPAEEN